MISTPIFSNDRYWKDPNTELKKKQIELFNEIKRNMQVIEACKELIKSYQKELDEIQITKLIIF